MDFSRRRRLHGSSMTGLSPALSSGPARRPGRHFSFKTGWSAGRSGRSRSAPWFLSGNSAGRLWPRS